MSPERTRTEILLIFQCILSPDEGPLVHADTVEAKPSAADDLPADAACGYGDVFGSAAFGSAALGCVVSDWTAPG